MDQPAQAAIGLAATFYTTDMEHAPTSAGTGLERTPRHTTRGGVGGALREAATTLTTQKAQCLI